MKQLKMDKANLRKSHKRGKETEEFEMTELDSCFWELNLLLTALEIWI